MHQVLFEIPVPFGDGWKIPIFGFGLMLFFAFIVGTWLASLRARAEGIDPQHIQDLALWVFVGGIAGARLLYMYIYPSPGQTWLDFFKIWQGGLILYGSVAGGLIAYVLGYFLSFRKHGVSMLRVVDIVAPSIALGLFFGRIGCLLNGCCYGGVVDPGQVPWELQFPANSPPHRQNVALAYQTGYGFVLAEENRPPQQLAPDKRTLQVVEAGPAAEAGLRPGDRITKVWDEKESRWVDMPGLRDLVLGLSQTPSGQSVGLTVERRGEGGPEIKELHFEPPRSLPVHPTQAYSSLDGLLLFLLLTAYYPFRRRPGEVMALFMTGYGITRFLIEALRGDNERIPFSWSGIDVPVSLTMSQYVSLLMVLGGVGLAAWLRLKPPNEAKAVTLKSPG